MAFRIEAKACARLIVWAALALPVCAQTSSYQVRHRHLHDGAVGILRVGANSVSFEECGKGMKHSREWKYDEIQELVLAPDSLRIVTYEDQRWRLGGDRVYIFDRLPAGLARDWYPVWSRQLDRRFVAALADSPAHPDWQIAAKLIHRRSGSQGVIMAATDRIVYRSLQPGESRTWRIGDLENVGSSDPFDLTIATHEGDFRFQLKQSMSETRFNALWRLVNQANGLQILISPR